MNLRFNSIILKPTVYLLFGYKQAFHGLFSAMPRACSLAGNAFQAFHIPSPSNISDYITIQLCYGTRYTVCKVFLGLKWMNLRFNSMIVKHTV